METIQNEVLLRIAESYKLNAEEFGEGLQLLGKKDHKYLKDLRINLGNALGSPTLTRKESLLLALSIAINEKSQRLISSFSTMSMEEGATEDEIAELYACVSMMNVNNIFYRFKHFTNKEFYLRTPAGIKMSVMVKPILGKEFFELVSLAVSAVNGCEQCVNSHEASVIQHGATEARVYDAMRLAAIIKGFSTII